MNQDKDTITARLLQLLQRLYAESDGLTESDGDLQLWYNRGYANGMIRALRDLGYAEQISRTVDADSEKRITGQELLPWGKAYLHGFEMGEKETREVL
ncbi:MAG: hypothetical protein JMN27_08850 [gamma proteobacterium endosymbiont of Lamellibrachia anaximandri]|nr:hypothetical protein [gamma proteobacterium endosymbiont of Lamellibrachia anaximandri]MBL3533926.1 hypothetical protein [gamma proteobacterium endosymbiont of Lamellibrachia anaximandri]MBL3599715.1 hypothetical protein [gamma proteobacterium endosymbiont of Lamellibrachia anaximandri]